MARPRKANSKLSLNHYGLKDKEDEELRQILKDLDLSASQVVRALLRQFIKEGGKSILKYSTK